MEKRLIRIFNRENEVDAIVRLPQEAYDFLEWLEEQDLLAERTVFQYLDDVPKVIEF